MRTVRTVDELRAALAGPRSRGARIGLVPTMGAFHEGHLSLIRAARAGCDVVVVSLFVNPAQFAPGEDLAAYPRDERRDAELAAEAGADLLFAPPPDAVYPDGFATTVTVAGVSESLCGAARGPGHFAGVATVVTKLLGMASPDAAYFGQKDYQQTLVISRLVADLNLDVEIVVCPIVREPDGLALSSRNAYLTPDERVRATALRHALDAAEAAVAGGERDPSAVVRTARAPLAEAGLDPEYVEVVDAATLAPLERLGRAGQDSEVLVAIAAPVGRARLIDNTLIAVPDPVAVPVGAAGRAGRVFTPFQEPPDMQRTMLKSKIHRATVTDSDLHYAGSITVDADLLDAADIAEHEQVHVVDVNNGERFITYTIAGERGSGAVQVNGAAARLVHHGDTVIVFSYATYSDVELDEYEPRVVHVTSDNRIRTIDAEAATLLG